MPVGDPVAWPGLAAAGGHVAALWLLRHRIGRDPLAGVLFFGVTLAPTLGFVDFDYLQFSFVTDRFQNLAGSGAPAVVIGAAVRGIAGSRGTGRQRAEALNAVLVAALLAVLGTLTWLQAANYRDGITFFRYLIAHHPEAREAHLHLGSALLNWNRMEEALAACRSGEQERPGNCKPPYGAAASRPLAMIVRPTARRCSRYEPDHASRRELQAPVARSTTRLRRGNSCVGDST